MSHQAQRDFIKSVASQFPDAFRGHVLDVGSLDINGNNREFCPEALSYTGIDLGLGPNVDLVCHAADFFPEFRLTFDLVVSTEALEHDSRWTETLWHMANRLVRRGGLVAITCASVGRAEHGTRVREPGSSPHTLDHYRNLTIRDFELALPIESFQRWDIRCDPQLGDLRFWGVAVD